MVPKETSHRLRWQVKKRSRTHVQLWKFAPINRTNTDPKDTVRSLRHLRDVSYQERPKFWILKIELFTALQTRPVYSKQSPPLTKLCVQRTNVKASYTSIPLKAGQEIAVLRSNPCDSSSCLCFASPNPSKFCQSLSWHAGTTLHHLHKCTWIVYVRPQRLLLLAP